jgi:ribonuclease HI
MAITIFTDGSSRGNPGPGGWAVIVRSEKEVAELGGREGHTTNNRMEISAALNALMYVRAEKMNDSIIIQTDSKYLISGITQWVSGWQRNGWKTAAKKDVENRDLWEALYKAVSGLKIEWKYVKGHAGHPGNERCDEIATAYADNRDADLYKGPRSKYMVDLEAAPVPTASSSSKKSSSVKAYSYLSLVDGVLEKHKTWAECEARVKGVRGARFKKSFSADDEKKIITAWKNI